MGALLPPLALKLAPNRFRRRICGLVAAGLGGACEEHEGDHGAHRQQKRQLKHG